MAQAIESGVDCVVVAAAVVESTFGGRLNFMQTFHHTIVMSH